MLPFVYCYVSDPKVSRPCSSDLKIQGSRCSTDPKWSRCPANPQVSRPGSLDLKFQGPRCPTNPELELNLKGISCFPVRAGLRRHFSLPSWSWTLQAFLASQSKLDFTGISYFSIKAELHTYFENFLLSSQSWISQVLIPLFRAGSFMAGMNVRFSQQGGRFWETGPFQSCRVIEGMKMSRQKQGSLAAALSSQGHSASIVLAFIVWESIGSFTLDSGDQQLFTVIVDILCSAPLTSPQRFPGAGTGMDYDFLMYQVQTCTSTGVQDRCHGHDNFLGKCAKKSNLFPKVGAGVRGKVVISGARTGFETNVGRGLIGFRDSSYNKDLLVQALEFVVVMS
ncbi:uncharacterized protein G2W53_041184 [Senna tora]|uniref:Uncharacterized protein n=1 Tax=Senna tora TaxID=362788 RepID=A0A834SEF5_9FABA|nr:uncharacterized protein G2W53_041184 [Senna tora]